MLDSEKIFYTKLHELLTAQKYQGLVLSIKSFIEANTEFSLNVGQVHARNQSFLSNENPLSVAIKTWNLELTELLLKHGANPNYQSEKPKITSYLPIVGIVFQPYCPEQRRKEMFELMFNYGMNVNYLTAMQESLLSLVVNRVAIDKQDNFITIDTILEKGAFINHNAGGETVLDIAVKKDYKTLAYYLVDKGANTLSIEKNYPNHYLTKELSQYYLAKVEKEKLESNLALSCETEKTNKLKI